MQDKKTFWFKILSWYVGIYHTVLGILGVLAPASLVTALASKIYGLSSISADLQFVVMARFAGAYMLALGIMAILMAKKPREYGAFILPIVIMIIFRIYTRLVHGTDIIDAFGGSMLNNVTTVVIIALIGLGLVRLRPKK